MYNETLKILMEGINDPIKKQILKNQLEYHFKNKTPENKNAIDSAVTIVRRFLGDFTIMDLISVQPIARWNSECDTIHNEDKEYIRTKTTGLYYTENSKFQSEVNQTISSNLDFLIAGEIIDYIVKHTSYDSINIQYHPMNAIAFTEHVVGAAIDIDATWAITSYEVAEILVCDARFERAKNGNKFIALNEYGEINGIKVYASLHIGDTIILGSKDDENPPIIFAPETMLIVSDDVDGENRRELLSSGEIFMDLDTVDERYRKISVKY